MLGRVTLLALTVLALARPAPGAPRPYADHLYATALPRNDAEVAALWRLAEHVLTPHDPRLGPHTVVISRAALDRLRAAGVELTVQPVDVAALFAEPPLRFAAAIDRGRLGIFGGWFGQVADQSAIDAYLDELARASNGRASVLTVGTTIEGRAIRALRVRADHLGPARASILVTGTQHAREWASTMVTMGICDVLVRQASDPMVRAITGTVDVYVIPVVNVDGYVASHRGWRMQRKNMNPRCGVDLNRNFDVAFGMGGPAGSAGCTEENYGGTAAFSEPETRAVKALAESLSDLRLYLDYHAPAEQVMIPFAHTRARPEHYEKSVAWAELYADTLKELYGTLHPAREGYDLAQGQGGGAIDWFRVKFGESFGIELRDGRELAGFQLPASQLVPTVEENWLAFRALAGKVAEEAGARLPMESSGPVVAPASVERAPAAAGCSAGGPGMPRDAGTARWVATGALLALILAAFSRRARRRI